MGLIRRRSPLGCVSLNPIATRSARTWQTGRLQLSPGFLETSHLRELSTQSDHIPERKLRRFQAAWQHHPHQGGVGHSSGERAIAVGEVDAKWWRAVLLAHPVEERLERRATAAAGFGYRSVLAELVRAVQRRIGKEPVASDLRVGVGGQVPIGIGCSNGCWLAEASAALTPLWARCQARPASPAAAFE